MIALLIVGVVILFAGVAAAQAGTLRRTRLYRQDWHRDRPPQLRTLMQEAASRAGLSTTEKLAAIVYVESRGNPNAVNPSDPSWGLAQVTLPVGNFYADAGEKPVDSAKLLQPAFNLKVAARFLADLEDKYSSRFPFSEWSQAYNVGETKFNRGIRNPKYGANFVRLGDGATVFLNPGQIESEFASAGFL